MNSVENYIYILKKIIYTHKYESILEMHCNGNKIKKAGMMFATKLLFCSLNPELRQYFFIQ